MTIVHDVCQQANGQGKPDDVAQRLYQGVERLVGGADKNGMGERYKVMAIAPASSSTPAAFEA